MKKQYEIRIKLEAIDTIPKNTLIEACISKIYGEGCIPEMFIDSCGATLTGLEIWHNNKYKPDWFKDCMICPECGSRFKSSRIPTPTNNDLFIVWCSYGPCKSPISNDGAEAPTVRRAAEKLQELISTHPQYLT